MKTLEINIGDCVIYSQDMPLSKLLKSNCDFIICENSYDRDYTLLPEDFEDCKTWKEVVHKCIREYKIRPTQIEVYPAGVHTFLDTLKISLT